MTHTVYLVIGAPGAGKSWICEQLQGRYTYVHHDLFVGMTGAPYLEAIIKAARESVRPLLCEAPFSISQIKDPLEKMNFHVIPVFIQEPRGIIADRYRAREGKRIPDGHLTRQKTYAERAKSWRAFQGTSSQVLAHLKQISTKWRTHWDEPYEDAPALTHL